MAPALPQLLGVGRTPGGRDQRIQPIEKDGIKVMSMGFLVPPGEAVVWRGPMLHGAITQFLRDTAWGDLDYLVIDMPPGTGDIALTLSQLLPLTGAVVVCTPQQVALLDAVKAIAMFRKVNIPLLGHGGEYERLCLPGLSQAITISSVGAEPRAESEGTGCSVPGRDPDQYGDSTCGVTAARCRRCSTMRRRGPTWKLLTLELARNLANRVKGDPPLPNLSVL